jgi:hypothetical protein
MPRTIAIGMEVVERLLLAAGWTDDRRSRFGTPPQIRQPAASRGFVAHLWFLAVWTDRYGAGMTAGKPRTHELANLFDCRQAAGRARVAVLAAQVIIMPAICISSMNPL